MGLMDKVTGRAKKAAGDLADDASLRREGKQEERKGDAKDELARNQEKADAKADEVADLARKTPSLPLDTAPEAPPTGSGAVSVVGAITFAAWRTRRSPDAGRWGSA